MVAPKLSTQHPLKITQAMVWIVVLVYGLALVGQSTYENFAMNREIETQKARIATLENQQKDAELSLIYYRSDAYKEIEARRRLNLKGADEHVVVLPAPKSDINLKPFETPTTDTSQTPAVVSPAQSWWNLFFSNKKTS